MEIDGRAVRFVVGTLIAAFAVAMVALYVTEFRPPSPFDEFQHFDYLDKAPGADRTARQDRRPAGVASNSTAGRSRG